MSSTVEQIKERLGIVEVVRSYVKLEKAGANFKARCPFHNEKTPSFFVSPSRGTYHCFGCNAGGDIFTFVEHFEGVDFSGALRVLADRAGIPIVFERSQVRNERTRLFELLEAATVFFEGNIKKNPSVSEYLNKRGIKDETIKYFRVGFSLPQWDSLYTYLKGKGFSEEEIEKAGLIKKRGQDAEAGTGKSSSQSRGYYDRFRGRVLFPISDSSGRIVAFSGRIFSTSGEKKDEEAAKYINSPETPLFDKSKVLYGFDKAKFSIRKLNCSIVVEGQMDLLATHQAGYTNAIALSGTALTGDHLIMLNRLSSNIVLAFDADSAGVSSSGRATKLALGMGMDVKIAAMQEGVDPADLISKDVSEWKKVVKEAKHVVDFYLDVLSGKGRDERTYKLEVRRIVLPYVAMIKNKIDQAHFIKRISEKLGVSEEPVREELISLVNSKEEVPSQNTKNPILEKHSRRSAIERKLLGIILLGKKRVGVDKNTLSKKLEEIVGKEHSGRIMKESIRAPSDILLEAEVYYGDRKDLREEAEDLLYHLDEECTREELTDTMSRLRHAEAEKKESDVVKLLKRCKKLSDKLAELNNRHYSQVT
jgi:DNA primase|tara:strand:- start:8768 stop:10540 length:1773 start_codon:yes stop_codon:yes gene_type:complete